MTLEEEVKELRKWKSAVIDALVVSWAYRASHESDPRAAIHALISIECEYALDPRISAEARALEQRGYERGIRVACNSFRSVNRKIAQR